MFTLVFSRRRFWAFLFTALSIITSWHNSLAQTTSFTYQGKLTDNGSLATGSYDLQFTLWDSLSGGIQQPQPGPVTLTRSSVSVAAGVFTVQLDFGVSAFPGADRFLEISVRPAGGTVFTTLTPRQQISSTPYAIRTLTATSADTLSSACVACVQDSQISQVGGSKVNGAIPVNAVPAGSASYIQNTTGQQAGSNFNISGNGTAGGTLTGNVMNAVTQYNFAGAPFASAPSSNTFVGVGAGQGNTGTNNSFFGNSAGAINANGSSNSFFGDHAGAANVGTANSAFFGALAGNVSTGGINSFFGAHAGLNNTGGNSNTFIGFGAGFTNTTGSLNTLIGENADVGVANITNATAIGANARVDASNSLVLGGIDGINTGTATNVGIGTTSPGARLDIVGGPSWTSNGWTGSVQMGNAAAVGWRSNGAGNHFGIGQTNGGLYFFRSQSAIGNTSSVSNYDLLITDGGLVGIGTGVVPSSTLTVNGCVTATNITPCSSDVRLKQNIKPLSYGLREVLRLHPVRWQWKDATATQLNMGLVAQEVEPVLPELVLQNVDTKGSLGLNYMGLIPVLVKGIQEQQTQIAKQQQQIDDLRGEIKQLRTAKHGRRNRR